MGTLRGKISFPGSLHGTLSGLEMIQGYSAYEVAVINGFEGTQEEWLESLKCGAQEAADNANAAADRANTSAENADNATVAANTAAENATFAAFNATDSAIRANEAADRAEAFADRVDTAIQTANEATEAAETATSKANIATEQANNARDVAQNVASDLVNSKNRGDFDGKDGFSPAISVSQTAEGHRLTITDANGTRYVDVMNGARGETGKGLDILGTYPTVDALNSAVTNPEQGDMYNVGSSAPYNLYMYDSKEGWKDQGKLQGAKGAVFTPFVDADGNLSWSNDGGLSNPATVNIKGIQGDTPDIRLETQSMSMGNVFVTSYSLIYTKPDGTEEFVSWTDGKDGQNGVSGGYYNPVLSADGVLSWDFINPSSMNPTPVQPWVDTKIVGEDGKTPVKGVDYFTDADIQEVAEQAAGMLDVPTGSWNDLTDKPSTFPPSTHNHSYNDLTNKPTLFSGNYNDLTNKPALFSGSYNDLSDKPTIPSTYTHPASHPASMITGLATVATSGSYNDLSNKPTIPSAYSHPSTHAASMISAGTFAGQVVANSSGQAAGSYVVRNSKLSSTEETPTVNGQICWKYK